MDVKPSLKLTAVASGSELIAQTERAVELASPRMVAPSKRVKDLPPWMQQ